MRDQTKINTAIHECLDEMRPDRSNIAHPAQFLERLRREPGWTENEIKIVETAVRKILAAVIDNVA